MKDEIRLKDITWGGRIRTNFQDKVWDIAEEASGGVGESFSGNMLTSQEVFDCEFMDGGVTWIQGSWGGVNGMRWHGRLAKAWIVYELGYDARKLLKDKKLPTHEELKKEWFE